MAIEVEVTAVKEHRTLAVNHRLKEEWDDAIVEYTKAIELDNKFSLAYFERGQLYKLLGKKSEAIADFEKVVSISNKPETVEAAKRYIEELHK
jgi:tetratricopeptide (TPR) repeat protein